VNAIAKAAPYELAIQDSKDRFQALAGGHLNYGDEEIFAMQMLTKSDFAFKTANANPMSVQLAMINVASTGLTLNPAMGYAFLVPRDNAIVLDISYKGLIKIATDAGAILWARAEVVHQNDKFTYRGPAAMPDIVADPFRERGAIIGVYCIAKTIEGDILTEVMDMAAIEKVRSKSTAWTKGGTGRKGPWEDFPEEMYRKAVIKRARKTWPYTDRSDRLAKAVEIANQAEGGYTFEHEEPSQPTAEQKAAARKAVHDEALGRHKESVEYIKGKIASGDMQDVANEWALISVDDQMALWLATSKGGVFTTEERKAIKERMPKIASTQEQPE
jgi:recombination protein RecT